MIRGKRKDSPKLESLECEEQASASVAKAIAFIVEWVAETVIHLITKPH